MWLLNWKDTSLTVWWTKMATMLSRSALSVWAQSIWTSSWMHLRAQWVCNQHTHTHTHTCMLQYYTICAFTTLHTCLLGHCRSFVFALAWHVTHFMLWVKYHTHHQVMPLGALRTQQYRLELYNFLVGIILGSTSHRASLWLPCYPASPGAC